MNIFKNKSIVAYISLVIPVLAVVLAIIGGATKGLLGDTFSWVIVLFLVLGAVVSIAAFLFPKVEIIQAIAPIFYGLALGLIMLDGVEVISYGLIGIDNDVGGQMSLTFLYLILGAVTFILSIASAFFSYTKKVKE